MKNVSNRHNTARFLESRGVTSDTITPLTHVVYVPFWGGYFMKMLISLIIWRGVAG
jgi:hypothetical protein